MKSAKKVPLDLTGGWEDIVNRSPWRQDRDRQEQAEKAQRTVRLERRAMVCGMGSALTGLLAFVGALSVWVAVPVAAVLSFVAVFNLGKGSECEHK